VRIITACQHISPDVIVKGFKMCCMSSAVDKTDGDMLWNGSEEEGHVRSLCEEGTDCEMELVTLIGTGRQNLTCFVY
jgi:hypothetical protein